MYFCSMQKKENKFQLSNVLTISIAHMLHDIYSSFLAPVLPLLIAKLGINYSLASFLTVAQRLPSLLNPFVGIMADKLKLRYLVIISPAITSICMSLIGVAPTYTVLVILLLVMGFSSTLFHVPSPVMIKKVAGNSTGLGMSLYMLGGEAARTLGPIVILGAVSLWTLEGTYRLIPFGLIVSLFLFLKFRKVNISEDIKPKGKKAGVGRTFKKHLPLFVFISGITLFRAVMKGCITVFLPTYLTLKGESLWLSGAALSIFQLAGAAGTLLAGPLSDKIGRGKLLMIVASATPIFMLLFVFSEQEWVLFLLLLLIGFFLLASTPIILAMVNDIKSDRPAFVNSIYMTISFAISSLTILLTGFMSDWVGMEETFQISAFVALGAIPFAVLLFKKWS